ncbi:MAG: hypothetical protein C4289_08365, partial [Chloroflexota bacterium]
MPPYSSEQGGAVVNAAINRFAYCTLRPRPDQAFHIYSADFDATVHVTSFADLVYDGTLDLIKAAIRRLGLRLRIYAPVGELLPGMAYLVRRLLENTSNESFVRQRFAERR